MGSNDDIDIIIVLVFGLPASGKSTVCKNVCTETNSRLHLCYDDLIDENLLYIERCSNSSPTFHIIRSFLVDVIYSHVIPFLQASLTTLDAHELKKLADELSIARFLSWNAIEHLVAQCKDISNEKYVI